MGKDETDDSDIGLGEEEEDFSEEGEEEEPKKKELSDIEMPLETPKVEETLPAKPEKLPAPEPQKGNTEEVLEKKKARKVSVDCMGCGDSFEITGKGDGEKISCPYCKADFVVIDYGNGDLDIDFVA